MSVNIETQSAGSYPDADEELLERVLNQLSPENGYVIAERDDRPGEFAQVGLALDPSGDVVPGKMAVEYRDNPEFMHQAFTSDLRTAHAVLAGWAFDHPGWKSLVDWHPLHSPA